MSHYLTYRNGPKFSDRPVRAVYNFRIITEFVRVSLSLGVVRYLYRPCQILFSNYQTTEMSPIRTKQTDLASI